MRQTNKFIPIGLLFNAIFLLSTRFGFLPDIIEGFCVGIGITFLFLGMLASKYDFSKIRAWKVNFIKNNIMK